MDVSVGPIVLPHVKMYCCAHGTFDCQHANGVQFVKLKTKYNIDKDIIVDYILQDNVRTSTRDWIGIFPRGWTNLQQYLTFEYVMVPPKALSLPTRGIMFSCTFHREASLNIDYQFLYVSKDMEILGSSSYFRFVVPPPLQALDENTSSQKQTMSIDDHPPSITSPNVNDLAQSHANRSNGDSRRKTFTETRFSSTSKFAPTFLANRVQLLLSHNEQIAARAGRLARDLNLSEAAAKNEKMARMTLTRRLQAYESFVAELFRCVSLSEFVKLTDKTGKEIVIRRVQPKELPTMRDEQADELDTIPEITMLNQSTEACNLEETTRKNKIEKFTPEMENWLFDESAKNVHFKKVPSPKRESTPNRDTKNLDITFSVDGKPSDFNDRFLSDISENGENRRSSCVTKEVTVATNKEDNACKGNCKIEQANHVEGGGMSHCEDNDKTMLVDPNSSCDDLNWKSMNRKERSADRNNETPSSLPLATVTFKVRNPHLRNAE